MSERKVIAINPESFSFSNTTKKKKKEIQPKEGKIKMRASSSMNRKSDTLRKRSVLKMIREQQSEQNRKQFTNYVSKPQTTSQKTGDFDDAKNFFNNMTKPKSNNLNHTLKQSPQVVSTAPSTMNLNIPEVSIQYPKEQEVSIPPMQLNATKIEVPKYGCLKNGNLPTYRDYMNKTRKTVDDIEQEVVPKELMDNYGGSNTFVKGNIMKQQEKLENMKNKKRKRLQKKIIRRTYKTGKSKTKPAISVLISNKTVRNSITEKKQILQQVPLQEVRKYLMRHGFIKVGTITPNDVLRQMYEAALLICGEVHNHNSDTLMYNFVNNNDNS